MIKNIELDEYNSVVVTTEDQILEFDILNPDDFSEYQDPEFIQEYWRGATGEKISLERAEYLIEEADQSGQLYFGHDDSYSEYYYEIYKFLREREIDCSEGWFRISSSSSIPRIEKPRLRLVS